MPVVITYWDSTMRAKTLFVLLAAFLTMSISSTVVAQQESEESDSKADEKKDQESKEERARKKMLKKNPPKTTILRRIGAVNSEGGAMSDALSDGADNTSLEKAFEDSKGTDAQTSGGPSASDSQNDSKKQPEVSVTLADRLEVSGTGKLDAKVIRRVLVRRQRSVLRCAQRSARKQQLAAGTLALDLVISNKGRVSKASIAESDFDKGLNHCVTRASKRLRFPRPKGGDLEAKIIWQLSPKKEKDE